MKFERACELLEIEAGDSLEEVKRKYRRLIAEIHPDSGRYVQKNRSVDITEVNAAYAFLVKAGEYQRHRGTARQGKGMQKGTWDAPINPGAYIEREVYQYAEDQEGNPIGIYTVAAGKYYWNHETEEFSLFLKSIISTVNRIIEKQEDKSGYPFAETAKFHAQKELIYLLAGQFTDIESGLQAFSKETGKDKNGNPVYYLPAMMEIQKGIRIDTLAAGEHLLPLQVKEHRLYLGKKDGQMIGYLSFLDDRVYYVLIPMFENREVQVKIEIAEKIRNKGKSSGSIRLNLWVRRCRKEFGVQENVNARISRVLKRLTY